MSKEGWQYLVQKGTGKYSHYTLQLKEEDDGIDRRADTQYELSAEAVQLNQVNCRFRKEDVNRYRGIKAFAFKGFQIRSADVKEQLSVNYALVTFVNLTEEHWLTWTTLQFILRRKNADDDIHKWHQVNDFTSASEIPSVMILSSNSVSASNSIRQKATLRQEFVNTGTEWTPQSSKNLSQQKRVMSSVSNEKLQQKVNSLKSEMLNIKTLLLSLNVRLDVIS